MSLGTNPGGGGGGGKPGRTPTVDVIWTPNHLTYQGTGVNNSSIVRAGGPFSKNNQQASIVSNNGADVTGGANPEGTTMRPYLGVLSGKIPPGRAFELAEAGLNLYEERPVVPFLDYDRYTEYHLTLALSKIPPATARYECGLTWMRWTGIYNQLVGFMDEDKHANGTYVPDYVPGLAINYKRGSGRIEVIWENDVALYRAELPSSVQPDVTKYHKLRVQFEHASPTSDAMFRLWVNDKVALARACTLANGWPKLADPNGWYPANHGTFYPRLINRSTAAMNQASIHLAQLRYVIGSNPADF